MTTALVATAPAALARRTIAHHSKSFALASSLLGRRLRDQTAVVYAWCRHVDDAIDERHGDLATLSRELEAAYAGTARDPVLAAFGEVARARRIPRVYADELLAGMAMDVAGHRYRTVGDTLAYAYRVAGTVGLMMSHVFGVTDDDALVHAAHLGIAMQLTNICRDVAEDARRGRRYLPDELVARHGTRGAVDELLALADRYYASGDRGIPALPWRAAVAVGAARRIYAAIGPRITDLETRAVVPTSTKLALAARALLTRPRFTRPHIPQRTLELADVPTL